MRRRVQVDEESFAAPAVLDAASFPPAGEFDGTAESWEVTRYTPVAVETPGGGRIRDKTPPPPANIVTVPAVGGKRLQLHRLAAEAWRALVSAARADGLREPLLLPVSGYRSPATQERLWQQALQKYGSPQEARKWVAPPGGSAHQTGRAIDFYLGGRNASANVSRLRTLPAYKWLVQNAARFGFYPYTREPWHWEYNPPASGQPEIYPESYETLEFWDGYEDEGVDVFAEFDPQAELTETELDEGLWGETLSRAPSTAASGDDRLFKYHPPTARRRYGGYSRYGGGRVDKVLKELRTRGQLVISNADIDMLQRIANVESGGQIQGINSYDSAFMSMGFMQWPIAYGKLQQLIQRAPAAFRRYGIELDAPRPYQIRTPSGTETPIAIKGASHPSALRSLEWAKRFYAAGLDPEIILAEVKLALEVIAESKRRMVGRVGSGFLPYYEKSPVLRALIQETFNNRPVYLYIALKRAMTWAGGMSQVSTEQFLELVRKAIREVYREKEPENGPQKAENLIRKTARL
jgi:hypothetical protein